MLKKLKKLIFVTAVCSLAPTIVLADTPIKIMNNTHYTNNALPKEKIIELVNQNVNLSPSANVFEARVQTIFNPTTQKPDYLLVYSLSSQNYSYTITQIKLNPNYQKTNVTEHYHLNKEDQAQQPAQSHLKADTCPDSSVELVTATPVPDITTAKAAVLNVARSGKAYGYNKATLLGDKATVENYVAYLSCPKLKAFYNVGHGSEDGIMLDDGVLSHDIIKERLKGKFEERAVILFNSCEVFNDPLKGSIIDNADAQKYIGGITPLYIGSSELASQCFWNSAFSRMNMTPSMEFCNKYFDNRDEWGIDGKGSDNLNYPSRV